jgi:four helix bundle protein
MRNEKGVQDLKARTREFALRVIRLVGALDRSLPAQVMGRQLLRSGTSVGANHRAACRARSRAEFVARMGVVEEELDESLYWMELLIEAGLVEEQRMQARMQEADELLAIVVTSIRTARRSSTKPHSR